MEILSQESRGSFLLDYLPATTLVTSPAFRRSIPCLAAGEECVHDGVFPGGIFLEADGLGEVLCGAFPFSFGGVDSPDAVEGLGFLRVGFHGAVEGIHRLRRSAFFHQ